jgi:hypothetical protein
VTTTSWLCRRSGSPHQRRDDDEHADVDYGLHTEIVYDDDLVRRVVARRLDDQGTTPSQI